MRIYIAGKITGLPIEQAQRTFTAAAIDLEFRGYAPINPMDLDHNHDKKWESYMRVCIAALVTCDSIYMLSGWQDSRGAVVEYELAKQLGLKIIHQSYDLT